MGQAGSCFLSVENVRLALGNQGAARGQEMDMTLKVFIAVGGLIVGIFIAGCGGDIEDSPASTVEKEPEPTFGLDGDTYRDKRLFKISNLPVDDWTVKEVTSAVTKGGPDENLESWAPLPFSLYRVVSAEGETALHQVSNNSIPLLLMQPGSEADFVDTLPKAFENRIPFIYIFIEVQSVTDFDSSKEIAVALLKQFMPIWDADYKGHELIAEGEIFSQDRRRGYFWEIAPNGNIPVFMEKHIFDHVENRAKQSFFVGRLEGNRFVFRLLFWAPADQYDKYVSVYDKIVSSVDFRL